jgi:hypothetical protein
MKNNKLPKIMTLIIVILLGMISYMYIEITTLQIELKTSKAIQEECEQILTVMQSDVVYDVSSQTIPEPLGEMYWNEIQDILDLPITIQPEKNKAKNVLLIIWANLCMFLMLRYYWLTNEFEYFNNNIDKLIVKAGLNNPNTKTNIKYQHAINKQKLHINMFKFFQIWKWKAEKYCYDKSLLQTIKTEIKR